MGIYFNLLLTKYSNLRELESTDEYETDQIDNRSYKYNLPTVWFALFTPADIDTDNYMIVTTPTAALKNLDSRTEKLAVRFGKRWDEGIEDFRVWLSNPDANYVILDLNEYSDMMPRDLFLPTCKDAIALFDSPLYEGKHLFSRKPKLSKTWRVSITEFLGNDISDTEGIF